jgi:hypothetical protein
MKSSKVGDLEEQLMKLTETVVIKQSNSTAADRK